MQVWFVRDSLQFVLIHLLVLPVRGSKFAAGYDLSSAEEVTVPSHGKVSPSNALYFFFNSNTL
jgi:dUTPase